MTERNWLSRGGRDEWDEAIDAFPRREGRGDGTDRWLRHGDPEVAHERQAFLEAHPWRVLKARIDHDREREVTRKRLNWTLGFSGLGLAASLAALLIVYVQPHATSLDYDPYSGIRMKGGAAVGTQGGAIGVAPEEGPVGLHLRTDGMAITSGATLAPGAELVFSVDTGAWDHVLVFGVEEDGTFTSYYPDDEGGQSLLVGRGRGFGLPDSVVLDDALGRERFVAVFSNRPLSVARVSAAAQAAFEAAGSLDGMSELGIPETAEAVVWFRKLR